MVREARSGRAFIASDDSVRDAVDGAPGRGLYDPPPGDKRDYCSLYCEGGITLVFPTTIGAGGGGFLSLDWVAGRMRYQVRASYILTPSTSYALPSPTHQQANLIAPSYIFSLASDLLPCPCVLRRSTASSSNSTALSPPLSSQRSKSPMLSVLPLTSRTRVAAAQLERRR